MNKEKRLYFLMFPQLLVGNKTFCLILHMDFLEIRVFVFMMKVVHWQARYIYLLPNVLTFKMLPLTLGNDALFDHL